MRIVAGLVLLSAVAVFAWTSNVPPLEAAPGERHYVKHFEQVGARKCQGYVSFEARFTGFAGRLNVGNITLFIVSPGEQLAAAIKKQHIAFQYHEEIKASAYKIPRFTLYLEGYAVIGGAGQRVKYARAPFKLQVSDALGDYTTPEFDGLDKAIYSGQNSWEASGAIADKKTTPLKVTEIYFKDYNIRLK